MNRLVIMNRQGRVCRVARLCRVEVGYESRRVDRV